jgi:hypothetical protein
MNDTAIRELTLATWAMSVWEKDRRGVPLQGQEAALAYCMRQHSEWQQYWNQLNTYAADNAKVVNMLVHIYNDAAVKLQLDKNDPPEIHEMYQAMRGKGITDMDALHAIAFVLQEQTWNAKTNGADFDIKAYVDRVKSTLQSALDHPELIRSGKLALKGRF